MSRTDAHIYDVGYRGYTGERRGPSSAMLTVAKHTVQRVLGLRRAFRHKILPLVALLIAFAPALVIAGISAFLPVDVLGDDILPTYGEYVALVVTALTLFAAFVAPEALCTDRRTKMLDLYLAGPLDTRRYLIAKWGAVLVVMLIMTVGPQLLILSSYSIEGAGPGLLGSLGLIGKIVGAGLGVALFFTAVALGIASLTTRRAVAAVATVLLMLIPPVAIDSATQGGGAPDELAVASFAVAVEFSERVIDGVEPRNDPDNPIRSVATPLIVAGLLGWVVLGLAVSFGAYRWRERRA